MKLGGKLLVLIIGDFLKYYSDVIRFHGRSHYLSGAWCQHGLYGIPSDGLVYEGQ